jgi:hypothetical protein
MFRNFFISLRNHLDFVAGNETGDEKGEGRAKGCPRRNGEKAFPQPKGEAGAYR